MVLQDLGIRGCRGPDLEHVETFHGTRRENELPPVPLRASVLALGLGISGLGFSGHGDRVGRGKAIADAPTGA